ncbi:MAG: zinc finger HIT domain-containing protein [Thermoplasmata archaeon]|nr:zinc finger HIT domain-containing protein [Thermoplasmata archaeon]
MCEICGIREAKYRCIRCGRKVCSSDYWTMLGICKLCLPEEEMKKKMKGKEHLF